MKLSTWIAVFGTLAITIWFALANRSPVTLSLDPFSAEAPRWAITVPVFGIVFIGVFAGMIAGGLIMWWSQGAVRREARALRRDKRRATTSQGES